MLQLLIEAAASLMVAGGVPRLAATRISLGDSGCTLPEQAGQLRELMRDVPEALELFGVRLLHAGLLDAVQGQYSRRFARVASTILPVSDQFPRLVRSNVSGEIRAVRYDLDLDLLSVGPVTLAAALRQLGVM